MSPNSDACGTAAKPTERGAVAVIRSGEPGTLITFDSPLMLLRKSRIDRYAVSYTAAHPRAAVRPDPLARRSLPTPTAFPVVDPAALWCPGQAAKESTPRAHSGDVRGWSRLLPSSV